jgi:signal transduction histidine kinase
MLLLSMLVVRMSLQPLRRVAVQADAITGRQSAGRLEEAGLPWEIQTLVRAINEALARLDRSLRFQREFTEDVAHELRTPLSVLLLQLERLSDDDVAAQLQRDVRGLIRFIEKLLEAAQIDALQIRLDETADLDVIARDVVAAVAPLALHAGRQIVLESNGAGATRGNVEAIALAQRNLIENALKASPDGGTVVVRSGPGPMLAVMDEGPGVDPALRGALVERFWQRDRRRPGAGLGLAIVKKSVDAHGGTLTIGENRPRGAVFTLAFPRG